MNQEHDSTLSEAIERTEIRTAHEARHIAHDREHELTDQLLRVQLEAERNSRVANQVSVEQARQIQFNEYERRLESLNGEASRLAKVLADSVPREVFENYKEEQAKNGRLISDTLAEERGSRATQARLLTVGIFVLGLLTFILKFLPLQNVSP